MSQEEMLKNEALEEILRERIGYYLSKGKTIDFWILDNPSFLDLKNLNQKRYSVLISLDNTFISWVRLRLGYFDSLEMSKVPSLDSLNRKEENYISNGFFGKIDLKFNQKTNENPLIQLQKKKLISF
jgi:hypothetical protein